MRGCLQIAVPIVILLALALYCAFPHPTHDPATLNAIAVESRQLIAAYPIGASQPWVNVPEDKWPAAIAGLEPFSVTVQHGMVDIGIKPYFDGGWGYGYAPERRNLTMLDECWSALGYDVYWHGAC